MARPEEPKIKDRRSKGGVFGEGMFPCPSARSEERCSKLPQWGLEQRRGDLAI